MSAFKLHTLKQKLWAIVAASFIARVVMLIALPSTPSPFAPDEGTYAYLAKWISESKPAVDFPGFGEGLYLSGRSLIIPASALIKLGMNELDAVRLTSSIYGLLNLCVVALLASKLLQSDFGGVKSSQKPERLVVSLILVYAFLPSHFVWSNLGLRESPNEFWLIATFVGVFLLFAEGPSKRWLLAALITFSIIFTFSSRPQVGWVLVVTLLSYSLFKLKNKLTYLLITSVLTGLIAGYLTTTSFAQITRDVYVAKAIEPAPDDGDAFKASLLCDGTKTKVEYESYSYECVKSGTVSKRVRPLNLAGVAIDQVQFIPERQIGNQVGAISTIKRLACPWNEISELGRYGCLAFRAPYMSLTFVFRPLPFIDTTSLSSVFAAAENTIWIAMFGLILYRTSKVKKFAFFREITPAIIFFFLYVVGAGSYEGNMGTGFRHKSLILWVVLLIIFSLAWPKPAESVKSKTNNSQESAV